MYAGWYLRPDGSIHACAINLGRRPTFYEHADHSLLEAHLLDFNDDLYGEPARVRFQAFLRSERKFDGHRRARRASSSTTSSRPAGSSAPDGTSPQAGRVSDGRSPDRAARHAARP